MKNVEALKAIKDSLRNASEPQDARHIANTLPKEFRASARGVGRTINHYGGDEDFVRFIKEGERKPSHYWIKDKLVNGGVAGYTRIEWENSNLS